ncbi:MAG: oxidoreductase [Acetobacteraceae bacterium]|nr:oxidoreductase [Acetobacteraceae bacterium]
MTPVGTIPLRVAAAEPLSPTLRRFVLEPAEGGELPTGSAGAHILLTIPGRHRTHRNAYSLITNPEERRRYEVVVRRVAESRGGSVHMHEAVAPGTVLHATWPTNLFPLASTARRHLLISGGIGITPMLSYLSVLHAAGTPYELHQICRAEDRPAFEALLAPFASGTVSIHGRIGLDLDRVLGRQPLGTHLYTCGPRALMDAVTGHAHALGWPASNVHTESFGDHRGGAPFRVTAARSGRTMDVAGDQTILEALEEAGIAAPCLCRGGVCGECRTPVLRGRPEHRDDVLDDDERRGNKVMMICVSRAQTPELVLDI